MSEPITTGENRQTLRSLDEMQRIHSDLVAQYREIMPPGADIQAGDDSERLRAAIYAFLRSGAEIGKHLSMEAERREAQSLLDYWVTILYRFADEPPFVMLQGFDPEYAPNLSEVAYPYSKDSISAWPHLSALYSSSPSLTAADLRASIQMPATDIGLKFDDGLVDELIRGTLADSAGLPEFSLDALRFALQELWKHREQNRITWRKYHDLKGDIQAERIACRKKQQVAIAARHWAENDRPPGELLPPSLLEEIDLSAFHGQQLEYLAASMQMAHRQDQLLLEMEKERQREISRSIKRMLVLMTCLVTSNLLYLIGILGLNLLIAGLGFYLGAAAAVWGLVYGFIVLRALRRQARIKPVQSAGAANIEARSANSEEIAGSK